MFYDARLENWIEHPCGSYIGEIFDDAKKRFADGQIITTSYKKFVKDGYLHTQNSIYKLGKPYVSSQNDDDVEVEF